MQQDESQSNNQQQELDRENNAVASSGSAAAQQTDQQDPLLAVASATEAAMNDMDSVILPESGSEPPSQQQPPYEVSVGWGEQHLGGIVASGQPSMLESGQAEDGDDVEEDDEATVVETSKQRRHRMSQQTQNMLVDESVEVEDIADSNSPPQQQQRQQISTQSEEQKQEQPQQQQQQQQEEAQQQQQHQPSIEDQNIEPQAFIQLVEGIIYKCRGIHNTIKASTEPTEEITSVVETLRKDVRYIHYAMEKILTPEQTSELIQALREMATAMLEEHIIINHGYLLAIFQYFHYLVVDFFPQHMHRYDMCQLIESLLKERASLYQALVPQASKSRRGQAVRTSTQQEDDKKREDLREVLNYEAESRVHARIQEESEWRQNLKVGDYLDALARYKTPQSANYNFVSGWAQAKILEADSKTIVIGFLGRDSDSNLKLNYITEEIAPFKKYTSNMAWNQELEEGSLLDACDDYGVWYRSTLARRYFKEDKLDCDGKPIEMFHIVCRYPDPDGTKTNKEGIKVTGWIRDDFDLQVEKTAPCIRPFTHYTTQYYDVQPDNMKYDLDVADQEDLLFQTHQIEQYARDRKSQFGGIKFIGTIFDDFGRRGGFNRVMALFDQISSGQLKTNVEHVSFVMTFLATSLPFWTREFMCTHMYVFVEKFQAAMGTVEASNPLNLQHTRGHINILINNYHLFLRRYFVARKHQRMVNYMNSLIGCSLLKLENLEKRIFGIKLISDQIGNLPYMDHSLRKKEEIVEDLKSLSAFEIIFSSKNYHQQILQRAEDVLRLYAQTQSLTKEMIDILWETRQMDETACISVYTIIGECIYGMQMEIVEYFVDKIKGIAPQSLQLRDVELILSIGRTSTPIPQSRYCADALWNIVFQQKTGYSQQILKVARKSLVDLLKSFDTKTKVDFINRCINHVSDPTLISLQVLKIMFKTISWLPKHNNAWVNSNQVTMKALVTELVTDIKLIDILLQDLEAYKESVLTEWRPEDINDLNAFSPQTIETMPLLSEGFTHSKNLEVRLNGILFILETVELNGPRVNEDQLQRLWDTLIVNTKLPGDQRAFFRFLRRVLQERDWLESSLVCKFFEEKIESNHRIVEEISLDGFLSIQTMFLYINEFQNFISIIKQPQVEKKLNQIQFGGSKGVSNSLSRRIKNQRMGNQDWQSATATAKNQGAVNKDKLEFRVHVHPDQLRGIEILWLLFQKAPSRDLDLLTQVVHFLAQVYHSISRVLEEQRRVIYSDFVQESLQRLQNSLSDGSQTFDIHKRDQVKNTMIMLVHSLSDTEVRGSASIRPHFNIDQQRQTIEDITVQSFLTKDGQPKFFSFSVDGAMTVWEFIDFIASKLNLSPRKIKVQRISSQTQARNTKKPEFNSFSNCNTLAEMKVENGEEFQIMRNINQSEKVSIINPQNNIMVPDVRFIFESWFDQYATPREQYEDADQLTEEKYMDKNACVEFMASTIKEQNQANSRSAEQIQLRDEAVKRLYKDYDSDEDGRLTKADFLRFYQKKCLESPHIVWQNLEKHNYGKDLHLRSDNDVELTYDNDERIMHNQEELPRYFISANQDQFNSLFGLEQYLANASSSLQQETMESVWNLIGRLKTNPQLYLSVLKNENLEQRIGVQNPDQVQSYRLLYSLQIIYGLLDSYKTKPANTVSLYREKRNNRPQLWNNNSSQGANGAMAGYDANFPQFEESKVNDSKPLDQIMEDDTENANENILGLVDHKNYADSNQKKSNNQNDPIPLQDAQTVEQENRQAVNLQSTTDRFGNQMTHAKRQILNWKGEIVQESLQITQVSDKELLEKIQKDFIEFAQNAIANGQEINAMEHPEMLGTPAEYLEELKSNWLIEFINKNGFDYLMTIMKTIVKKNVDAEQKQILNKKAEVSTLRLVAYLIKVILISCFCSQTEDANLAGNLQRKMSSVGDQDSQAQGVDDQQSTSSRPKNDLISKQENITNEYKMLTEIFATNSETTNNLLQRVNLNELQDLLQQTLRIILKKQYLITELDRQVVAECLDIWVSCITFKNDLLLSIYGDDDFQNTEIVTMLIDQGLFSETASLRRQFKEAIEFMSFNIKTGVLPTAPAIFFLQKLLGQIDHCKQLSFTRTPDFFELVIKLVKHYFAMEIREPMNFRAIFEPAILVKDLIKQLDLYKSQESKTSIVADHTLVGIIQLAQTLLQANGDILDQDECSNIMTMLIRNCLFNQTQEAYSGNIMSNIDLASHSSSQVNKCHTDESRNAAYSLLDTVLNSNSDPRLIQSLVEDFWNPFVLQLDKQKESGVAPQDSGRSQYGYAGIKNLGCICYMNSMMQQLFCVPSFRYSLLATDDRQEADWQVDTKGQQVDNNSLHQWLKMFSFLQMTDRQEYNPSQFCFAFKEYNGDPTNVRVQQDAQEFLNLGFDRLEKLLKDTPQKYICQSVFQGQMTGLTVCKNCGNIVCTDQPFYTLQCTVKNQKTLQSSLESMIAGEKIDDYNCSACNQKVTIEKKQCIRNLPNTLIVHLNRIVFDFDTMRNVKLNDKLEFPNLLNVRQFMLHQVLADMKKNEESQSQDKIKVDRENREEDQKNDEDGEQQEARGHQQPAAAAQENADADDQPIEDEEAKKQREEENQKLQELVKEGQKISSEEFDYKLVGVVIHMGIADAGHYISYINIERGDGECAENRSQWLQTDKQTWLEFNDSIVSNFDFSQMQFKAFGDEDSGTTTMIDYNDMGGVQQSQQSHNAYMLVYEKAQKKPLKLVCHPENLSLIKAQPSSVIAKLDILLSSSNNQSSNLSCEGTANVRDNNNNQEQQKLQQQEENMDDTSVQLNNKSDRTMQSTQANTNAQSDTEMASSMTSSETSATKKNAANAQSAAAAVADTEEESKQMSEFMSSVPHSFLIYPQLISQLYDNSDAMLKYDEEQKEHYVEVPFNNVQQFVPNEYYKLLHADNQLFLAEKQVFCTPFFKTSAQMIEQYLNSVDQEAVLLSAEDTQRKRLQVFKVLDKLIFEMLVNGTEQQQKNLPQITILFFRVMEQSQASLFSLINDRILLGVDDPNQQQAALNEDGTQKLIDTSENANKKPKKLEDKIFFDMLVTGRTQQVRELTEQVLTNVMLNLFKKLDSNEATMVDKRHAEELIERIIHELLILIPVEVQKFWHKLGAFFNFFHNMIKDFDVRRVSYFVQTGLISRLIDLTGRYNSQVEYSVPPFDRLVNTVCILARSQPLILYLHGIPDEFQVTEDEFRNQVNTSQVSPQWIYNQPDNPEIQQQAAAVPMLSIMDLKNLLMTDKRSKDFFNIALKNTQESKDVALLIGQLCWGNYECSRRFGKLILKGLNNTNELEVKPYVDCMMVYLALEDQFQEERVEWILGIAFYAMNRANQGQYSVNRVGLQYINNIDDLVTDYETTLFKTKTEIEESVLKMIYKYRKERFVRAALALLEGISWVMAHADKRNILLKHLLTVEPPAYTCRRYWDWIEPHVRDHIQNCSDNIHLATSSEELETCMRIFSNIEHIKAQYGSLIDVNDENKLVEQGAGGRPVPDPYLMWDIESDRLIASFPENENARIKVSIHECKVFVTKSRPTGSDNESVQKGWNNARINFVQKSFRSKRGKQSGYGRGSRTAANARANKDQRHNRWLNNTNITLGKMGNTKQQPGMKSSKRRSGEKQNQRNRQAHQNEGVEYEDPQNQDGGDEGDSQEADNSNDGSNHDNNQQDEAQYESQGQVANNAVGADHEMHNDDDNNFYDVQEEGEDVQANATGPITGSRLDQDNESTQDQAIQAENDNEDPMASGQVQANPTVNMFEDGDATANQNQPNDSTSNPNEEEPFAAPLSNGDEDENMAEGLGAANDDVNAPNQDAPNAHAGEDQHEEEKQEPGPDGDAGNGEGAPAQDDHYDQDGQENTNLQNPYIIENDEGQPEELIEDPKTEEYVILVFLVNNQDRRDARITIAFNQQNRDNVNFRQPVTDYTEVFVGGKSALPLKFGKVKLGQDWGKLYDWKIIINGVDIATDQKWDRFERDHPLMRAAKIPLMEAAEAERVALAQANQPIDQDLYDDQVQYQQASGGPAGGAEVNDEDFGKVNCPVCTYLNAPFNSICEICQSPLGR